MQSPLGRQPSSPRWGRPENGVRFEEEQSLRGLKMCPLFKALQSADAGRQPYPGKEGNLRRGSEGPWGGRGCLWRRILVECATSVPSRESTTQTQTKRQSLEITDQRPSKVCQGHEGQKDRESVQEQRRLNARRVLQHSEGAGGNRCPVNRPAGGEQPLRGRHWACGLEDAVL